MTDFYEEWRRSPFRVEYVPDELRQTPCGFCKYLQRPAFRAAMFRLMDFHNSQAEVCKAHLGPMLQALNMNEITIHVRSSCRVCAQQREHEEWLRDADAREQKRLAKAEAKKLKKQVLNVAADIAKSARDAADGA